MKGKSQMIFEKLGPSVPSLLHILDHGLSATLREDGLVAQSLDFSGDANCTETVGALLKRGMYGCELYA